ANWRLLHDTWFDTVTVITHERTDEVIEEALARGINLRRVDDDHVGVSCDQTTSPADVAAVLEAFGAARAEDDAATSGLPPELERSSGYLTHPVFHQYRSETEMLRYL